jgi:hypothetical protein
MITKKSFSLIPSTHHLSKSKATLHEKCSLHSFKFLGMFNFMHVYKSAWASEKRIAAVAQQCQTSATCATKETFQELKWDLYYLLSALGHASSDVALFGSLKVQFGGECSSVMRRLNLRCGSGGDDGQHSSTLLIL